MTGPVIYSAKLYLGPANQSSQMVEINQGNWRFVGYVKDIEFKKVNPEVERLKRLLHG